MGYKRQTNVLLIGEINSANVGDQIIGITVYEMIKNRFPNAQVDFLDLSGRDTKLRKISPIDIMRLLTCYPSLCFHRYRFPQARRSTTTIRYIKTMVGLMRKLRTKQYNLVMFDGGALFQDYFAELIEFVVKESSKFCDRIVFHACGLGELSKYSISCLGRAFHNKKVSGISLRDSFQRFAALFPDIHVTETFDTAINCSRIFIYSPEESRKTEIGLGCISVPGAFEIQCKLIKALMKSDITWKLFTTGEPADYRVAEALLKQCSVERPKEHLCERPLKPEDLIKTITGFDSIISFRMHSLVVSASYAVPMTGIVWDNKVKFFLQGIGLDHYIDICTTLSGEDILRERCIALPEETKARMDSIVCQTQKVLFEEVQGDCNN